jgi:hypothetical protein
VHNLLILSGLNNVHTTSPAVFAFCHREDQELFNSTILTFNKLCDHNDKVDDPEVFITDFCKANKIALDDVFTDIKRQICVWTIMG